MLWGGRRSSGRGATLRWRRISGHCARADSLCLFFHFSRELIEIFFFFFFGWGGATGSSGQRRELVKTERATEYSTESCGGAPTGHNNMSVQYGFDGPRPCWENTVTKEVTDILRR